MDPTSPAPNPGAIAPPPPPLALPPTPLRPASKPTKRLIALAVVLLVVLVAVAWLVGHNRVKKTAVITMPAATPSATIPLQLSSGSDNQSLNNDLNTIGGGLNTENQDQQSATNAINDQQREVNVPTN